MPIGVEKQYLYFQGEWNQEHSHGGWGDGSLTRMDQGIENHLLQSRSSIFENVKMCQMPATDCVRAAINIAIDTTREPTTISLNINPATVSAGPG